MVACCLPACVPAAARAPARLPAVAQAPASCSCSCPVPPALPCPLLQGLGKTISTIALIVSNRPKPKQQGQPARLSGAGSSSASLARQAKQGRKRRRPAAAAAGGEEGSSSSSDSDSETASGSSSDEYPTSSSEEEGEGEAAATPARSGAAGAAARAASNGGGGGKGRRRGASVGAASSEDVVILPSDGEGDEEAREEGRGRLMVSQVQRWFTGVVLLTEGEQRLVVCLPSWLTCECMQALPGVPHVFTPAAMQLLLPSLGCRAAGRHAGCVPHHGAAPVGSGGPVKGQPTCRP